MTIVICFRYLEIACLAIGVVCLAALAVRCHNGVETPDDPGLGTPEERRRLVYLATFVAAVAALIYTWP